MFWCCAGTVNNKMEYVNNKIFFIHLIHLVIQITYVKQSLLGNKAEKKMKNFMSKMFVFEPQSKDWYIYSTANKDGTIVLL